MGNRSLSMRYFQEGRKAAIRPEAAGWQVPIASAIANRLQSPGRHYPGSMKWVSISLIAAALIVVGVFEGPPVYRHFLVRRLRRAAEGEAAKMHTEEAIHLYALAAQRDPTDLQTLRLFAAYLGKLHHPAVLEVLGRINALDPKNPDFRLEFAAASLSFGRVSQARGILAGADAATRTKARYYHLTSVADFMAGDLLDADATCQEALKLEPGNKVYLANQSTIRLSSSSEAIRRDAIEHLEQLSGEEHVALTALQSLLHYAAQSAQPPPHLEQWLQAFDRYVQPHDYLYTLRLEALRRHRPDEFRRDLALYLQEATHHLENASGAAEWLAGQLLYDQVESFWRSLPAEWQERAEFQSPLVEAYFGLGQMEKVTAALEKPAWKAYPADALAWQERVRRTRAASTESPETRTANWRKVLAAAGASGPAFARLLDLTMQWHWKEEYAATLWTVIDRIPTQAKDALSDLFSLDLRLGDTRDLLRVVKKQVASEPDNPAWQNNLAFLDLLLETDLTDGERIAKDLIARFPGNPAYRATLAFAHFKRGRFDEGVALFRDLDAAQLRGTQPGVTYGLLLAATGRQEAAPFLEGAETWMRLPEERSLLDTARRQIASEAKPDEKPANRSGTP